VRIGRFAVGEGGADLLREIDRQSSLAVVRDESAGRTDIAWGYIRRAGALVEIAVPPDPGFDPQAAPDPTPLWNILDWTPGGRGTDSCGTSSGVLPEFRSPWTW